ncbi:hypothetical protein AAHE18_03G202100 [Arachis hypogaea]|nr:uncharacterized protein DS421_3g85830 [Arachis hypogaea]
MMIDRRRILCASFVTLLLMTHKALGEHGAAILDAQTTQVISQHKTLFPYHRASLFFNNNRKLAVLGVRRRRGGMGTRGTGKKSSAIRVRTSVSQASLILCTSLLIGFFLLA